MGYTLSGLTVSSLQGQFPYGIEILSTCDYFAVGNRNNCYLDLRYVIRNIIVAITVMYCDQRAAL